MRQNSLERLLAGMAASLRDVVEPALTDPYARSQVQAAVDLLRNLAPRVEWRCDDLLAVTTRLRDVLAEAVAEALDDAAELAEARAWLAQPPPAPTDNAALVAARTAGLRALAAVQDWAAAAAARGDAVGERVRERTRDLAAWQLEQELGRLVG